MESQESHEASKRLSIRQLVVPVGYSLVYGAVIGYTVLTSIFGLNWYLGLALGAVMGAIVGFFVHESTPGWITPLEFGGSILIVIYGCLGPTLSSEIELGNFCHGTETGGNLGTLACLNENTPWLVFLVNTMILVVLLFIFKLFKVSRTYRLLLLTGYAVYIALSPMIWI